MTSQRLHCDVTRPGKISNTSTYNCNNTEPNANWIFWSSRFFVCQCKSTSHVPSESA